MIELAPYQLTAQRWLQQHWHTILADEPGVGKTHPAIMATKDLEGPMLVVAPAYLATNWQEELSRCDETDVVILQGSIAEKRSLVAQHHRWFIVSYELFARTEWFQRLAAHRPWSVVVFDEAHRLRGRNSARTEAAHEFRSRTCRVWLLTGTPTVTSGADLYPLLKLIEPKTFTSYWRFAETWCYVRTNPWARVPGKPKDPEAFTAMLKPYMLRRKIEEVLPDIPDVVETVITVDLTLRSRQSYRVAKKNYLMEHPDGKRTRIGAGELVSSLRRFLFEDPAKMDALKGLLEDIPADEQVVIFCWHRSTCQFIFEDLSQKYGIVRIDGGDPVVERMQKVKLFQDGQCRLMVATLATMQEGVNLQNAHYVIFMEEDWVGVTNEQAVARLRRRGQTHPVLKYSIVVKQSVDTAIHKAQAARSANALQSVFDALWEET